MLKLWGRLNSINVQKVVFALGEVGVPFERHDAGLQFGVVGTPEFKALNPNNLVPVIHDDGFVLWESNAIVRYLADRYGRGTLQPESATARASADAWMDWQVTTLYPAIRDVFFQTIRTPEAERNQALIDAGCVKMEAALAILDRHLAGRAHVAGERFSMGDIPVGLTVHRWLKLPVPRQPHPHVEAWYGRLAARQASQPLFSLPVT